jgi:hypothetical protein
MLEVERRVNLMVGEYTMNEYKAYKALVKHKRRIIVCSLKFVGTNLFTLDAQVTN